MIRQFLARRLPWLRPQMSLADVAERLRNERISRIVETYSERRVSVRRAVVMAFTVAWTAYWAFKVAPESILPPEAQHALPLVVTLFLLSVVWAFAVRTSLFAERPWLDWVGAASNYVGIYLMLSASWNLLVSFGAVLPLSTITMGARYSKRVFYLTIIVSIIIVAFAAPAGWWIKRPAFFLFTLVLMAGVPYTAHRLLTALRDISEQAVLARDAQSRFVATMSHELRTPLNTVFTVAESLDDRQLSDDQKKLIHSLLVNAQVLRDRVNEVLDVGAIDGGRLHLVSEPFRFSSLLGRVGDVLEPQASNKGVTLAFKDFDHLSDVLLGDPSRIEQVLLNLISNAIKFTPAGGRVDVAVAKGTIEGSRLPLQLEVRDTGIGIPDAEKERIFEPFHQVSGGATRRHDGVGLGLHIVRSVSNEMGGELTVSDNVGGIGSVFEWRITLPLASADQTAAQSKSGPDLIDAHRESVRPMRCLVIEDNAANREIIGNILTRAGHHMEPAEDGAIGLAKARASKVDVIFLDLHMPGMSGWQVLDALHVDPGLGNAPPVVILSAEANPDSIILSRRKQAFEYLTKPISVIRLLETLERVARMSQPSALRRAIEATSRPLTTDESPLELMRSLANAITVRDYLSTCAEGISDQLGNLEKAILVGDSATAIACTHALKNEFLNVARRDGVSACAELTANLRSGRNPQSAFAAVKFEAAQAMASIRSEPEYERAG